MKTDWRPKAVGRQSHTLGSAFPAAPAALQTTEAEGTGTGSHAISAAGRCFAHAVAEEMGVTREGARMRNSTYHSHPLCPSGRRFLNRRPTVVARVSMILGGCCAAAGA